MAETESSTAAYTALTTDRADVAERFGLVAAQPRAGGTPIPTNDIWTAAHAMETGARLLSYDGHFAKVTRLLWDRLSLDAYSC